MRFFKKLKRAIDYAVFGWNNSDWDYGFLEKLIEFKLKRMQHNFIHYGYHLKTDESYVIKMKALRVALKAIKRANTDRFIHKHLAKYSEYETHFTKPGSNLYDPYVTLNGVEVSNSDEILKKSREAVYADEREYDRYMNIFYDVIKKYRQYWWD